MSEEMDMSSFPVGSRWEGRYDGYKDKELVVIEKTGPVPYQVGRPDLGDVYHIKGLVEGKEIELTDYDLKNDWTCLDTGLTYTKTFHVGDWEFWSFHEHLIYGGLSYAFQGHTDFEWTTDGRGHQTLTVRGDVNKFLGLVALIEKCVGGI